jgi:hypothetical protein
MTRHDCLKTPFLILLLLTIVLPCFGGTVVFYEKNFPTVENGAVSRAALEQALRSLNPRFVGLADLQREAVLGEGDLLVLPFGSALPVDAWNVIRRHLDRGNLLVLGGRPFFVPVRRDSTGWHPQQPQNGYALSLGIAQSYAVPQHGPWTLQWDENAPWFRGGSLDPRRVFVNAGFGGRYRGIGFLVDTNGNRLAAPVAAEDLVGHSLPARRRVYLSFDAEPGFWNSPHGIELVRKAAVYASHGGVRLWLDLEQLTLDPGQRVTGAVDVLRGKAPALVKIELLSGARVLASRTTACGGTLHEEVGLALPLNEPGLYTVRASLLIGDSVADCYTSGVWVRDSTILHSGARLEAGEDYFHLDGKPYLMAGVNYFSTDPYTRGIFTGGSIGGNAWAWDRDFAEIERQGMTAVRTGIWLNRGRYLDVVSGAADERLLGAIEAFLLAAARRHMQVIFTFFAFEPQTEMVPGPGQETGRLGPGSNPYLDPVAIDAQLAYVRAIVSRFRDVPFLSFDLINEPSFSNPKRLWKGNTPNGDPRELAAWQQWLARRYKSIDVLAGAWRTPAVELGGFERVPLPAISDLEFARTGSPHANRAIDYNLFAQDAFRQWADTIIAAIRAAGARQQLITVGQDEGGVTDRLLNQFWGQGQVNYTVNHSWWKDDALLWNSIAAKTIGKPNLIGETGPQPVWSMDGSSRWDDVQGTPLVERKLALGFAGANAGVLHWDWTRSDDFGLLRRDGSQKQWMQPAAGIAAFARTAQAYALGVRRPDIALVLPQSLQLSVFGTVSLAVQQNAVRALYHYARGTAFAVGEYQLSKLPEATLIIVPAPWVISQEAWDALMGKVRAGATLLISGRVDADEHWQSVPERTRGWSVGYSPAALTTREALITWPGGSAHVSYSGERTTYAERGVLADGKSFLDVPFGAGHILYFPFPLELADQLDEVGRIYKYAMTRAGVTTAYTTDLADPGILICPTQLQDATLYVLTSESAVKAQAGFRDNLSKAEFRVSIEPGRAVLLLVSKDGRILASYNFRKEE